MSQITTTPESPAAARRVPRAAAFNRMLAGREISVLFVLLVLGIAMMFTSARHTFYERENLENIAEQVALLGIFAIGETIVIITGGIDLSLGSLIAYTGMVLAFLVTRLDLRVYTVAAVALAIAGTLVVSVAIGAWHAALIHKVRLPAFVVTLVSLLVLRSQSMVMNHHQQIVIDPVRFPLFDWLANGKVLHTIPVPAIILVLVAVAAQLILTRTRMGRYLYSVGSNEQATMLSGVNVFRVKLFAYGASALLGGLAGILWAGYGGQGDPQAGNAYELDAVAAAVVGGASLMGGQGSIMGTVLGACLLNSIFSAINLTLSEPSLWRGTVVGGVLLLAVLATAIQQRGRQ
ncbi:MAG TPA: ABC transporter permease [Chthonomonadales bacterium]|nr:ABC transporter permease [Chthonomonadales bacterium]